jgi:hypothetical protein
MSGIILRQSATLTPPVTPVIRLHCGTPAPNMVRIRCSDRWFPCEAAGSDLGRLTIRLFLDAGQTTKIGQSHLGTSTTFAIQKNLVVYSNSYKVHSWCISYFGGSDESWQTRDRRYLSPAFSVRDERKALRCFRHLHKKHRKKERKKNGMMRGTRSIYFV